MMPKRKATAKQIAANRANAKKSTGPKTEKGKAQSSQNRRKHGLTSGFHLIPSEDHDQYHQLLDQLMIDEKPVGIAEIELVKTMAQHLWMSRRADAFQTACFMVTPQTPEQVASKQAKIDVRPEIAMFLRYQTHHYRIYEKASNELIRRRKERRLAEIGFESQKRAAQVAEFRRNRENRQVERHLHAVALDKKHLELADIKVFTASASAVSRFERLQPTQNGKMAA